MRTVRAGYRVRYWDSVDDRTPKILHEPLTSKSDKLSSGKISHAQNAADTFTFKISTQNSYYQKLQVIVGIIEVENIFDGSIEFRGRILEISGEMSSAGLFYQEVTCESDLGYLNDMTLAFEKRVNNGPGEYLRHIISFHNSRVPQHKKFHIGTVTMNKEDGSDAPYLYTTYESTWEAIKNRLIDKYGGYIVLRQTERGNYIDYLKEVGEHKTSPIQLGKNIKSATRNISLADMMTQIVPIGGDLDTQQEEESSSTDIIRPQVNIGPVNGGAMSLSDNDLIAQFGIIRKVVVWSGITDPAILKSRGEQYLKTQKVALANWKVSVVDRSLIDKRYEKFELNNYHPIINAPLSGIEELQIIEKEIYILNPQSVELTIGADKLTMSSFNLQQQAAKKSMEALLQNQLAERKQAEQKLAEAQKELAKQMVEVSKATTRTALEASLSQTKTLLSAEEQNHQTLTSELERYQSMEGNYESSIALLQVQLTTSQTRIDNYKVVINEINTKLGKLEGNN